MPGQEQTVKKVLHREKEVYEALVLHTDPKSLGEVCPTDNSFKDASEKKGYKPYEEEILIGNNFKEGELKAATGMQNI